MAQINKSSLTDNATYTWDMWYIPENDEMYRLYFLNTPAERMKDERDDSEAKVGTALTRDFQTFHDVTLENFTASPDVEAWDAGAIWSGCVRKLNDGYALFYTAIDCHHEAPKMQSIGIAYSEDGIHWQRIPQMRLNPDSRWYEINHIPYDTSIASWRDPFVFMWKGHPHMLVSAKSPHLEPGNTEEKRCGKNGVIAVLRATHADSLLEWEATPLCFSAGRSEMELPQIFWDQEKQQPFITFSAWEEDQYFVPFKEKGGLYGFHADLDHLLAEGHSTPVPVQPQQIIGPEAGLYGFAVIPEMEGRVVGFDTADGGIGITEAPLLTHLYPLQTGLETLSLSSALSPENPVLVEEEVLADIPPASLAETATHGRQIALHKNGTSIV